ncbi:MAG: DoxX family protein [Gemmatimonadota bacterium]
MEATLAGQQPPTRTARAGTTPAAPSKAALRAGYAMSTLVVLFLLFDSVGKFMAPPPVVEGTTGLGYDAGHLVPLGVILLACTLLYAFPRTAVLGAVLLTGYLGGAVATHLRVWNPLPSHTLFPVYVGVLAWGGLWLRDPRLRALLPLRRRP